MRVFADTNTGKVRNMNQDSYFASNDDSNMKLFILADGMGGYNGGEIASKMAIEASLSYIEKRWEDLDKSDENILKLLKETTEYANSLIYEKAMQTQELHEMGTTMEICIIYDYNIYISHIGDSRIYIVTPEYIEHITVDHTYVEKLIEEGSISETEAENHPDKHMLTKALGSTETVEPDIFMRKWNEDESILICSDGLTNMLKDEEIQEIVISKQDNPEKTLIEMANNMGGVDNITIILINH